MTALTRRGEWLKPREEPVYRPAPVSKARRLRDLSIMAYWAANTPLEAKMASILLALYAPDVERSALGTYG